MEFEHTLLHECFQTPVVTCIRAEGLTHHRGGGVAASQLQGHLQEVGETLGIKLQSDSHPAYVTRFNNKKTMQRP